MPVPADEREVLMRYLRVQRVTDAEVRALLRQAARDLARAIELNPVQSFSDSVRLAQLRIQYRVITEELWTRVGVRTRAGKIRATDAAVKGGDKDLAQLLRRLDPVARRALIEGAERAARDAVARAVARAGGRAQILLSERVYRNRSLMQGTVDRLINSGIARGLSAREMAAEVRKYVLPSTPGGASYAAMRLARTELNNSYHAASAAYYEDNPFVEGMKWNLSRSHPKADLCDDYANDNHAGQGAGVFSRLDVPPKPHPQCFCYVVPVVPDDDELIRRYSNGDYNDFLARQGLSGTTLRA